MIDLDEAFFALEELDERGRKALVLSALIWEETLRDLFVRAERAEFLLARLEGWARGWGMRFDLGPARREWEARRACLRRVLGPRYQVALSEAKGKVRELTALLEEVTRAREHAEAHAAAAEEELRRLRAEGGS